MASPRGLDLEASAYNTPKRHSTPSPGAHSSTITDDSEEWEYEYSTTETETYYLTLDLTTPSIPCARPPLPKAGRGGYRPTWINSGRRRQKRHLELAPTISLPDAGVGASVSTPATATPPDDDELEDNLPDDDGVVEDVPDDDKEAQERQEPIQNDGNENGGATESQHPPAVEKLERLQILDLHTKNPLVTYKSHTFSCDWAENIGTELLFTFHDPAKPLPALRSLPDNVDLLAASSARLISKSITMIPKPKVKLDPNTDYMGHSWWGTPRRGKMPRGIIPIGSGASDFRRAQARFLERMMKIKHRNGEKDAVTVVAHRRLYPAGWRAAVKEKRSEERARLRSLLVGTGEDGAKNVIERLEEMDREDKVMAEEVKVKKANAALRKSKPGRKPKEADGQGYAKRTKGTFGRRPRGGRAQFKLFQADPTDNTPMLEQENNGQTLVSTPTPQRWNELDNMGPELDSEDIVEDDDMAEYEDMTEV